MEKVRQQNQKQELQNELKKQMEEQKRRKEEEVRKKRDEEAREEERVLRERQKMEEEFRNEECKKKVKVVEFQQANANLVQEKKRVPLNRMDEDSSSMLPQKVVRENLFGNGPSLIQPQFEGFG